MENLDVEIIGQNTFVFIHLSIRAIPVRIIHYLVYCLDTNPIAARVAASCGNTALRMARIRPEAVRTLEDPFSAAFTDAFPRQFIDTDLSKVCSYALYLIQDGDRLVDDFIPAQMEVRQSSPRHVFWPGSAAALLAKHKVRAAGAGGHAAPAGPGAIAGADDAGGVDNPFYKQHATPI